MGEIVIAKKWPVGTREFEISVTHLEDRGSQTYLPLPLMQKWNFPEKVRLTIAGDKVIIRKA